MMLASLYSFLTDTDAITTLVSTRIYPGGAPRGESRPWVTFDKTGGAAEQAMSGPTDLSVARVRITSWADSLEDAVIVASAINGALDGKTGTVGSHYVQGAFRDNETSGIAPLDDNSDVVVDFVAQDFEIWYQT